MAKKSLIITLFATAVGLWLYAGPAVGCGGLFCQNDPVDQVGERIVFTVNADETITSLIEIQYFGEADDFAWVLPIPEAIAEDDLAVPEDGDTVFDELHALTDVRVIAPPIPDCVEVFAAAEEDGAADESAEGGDVEVFASGEVGPFGFDVIGSDDSEALLNWLQDNDYRVEDFMEPFIDVYVEEEFAFIAMRLLDGETNESIQPIEITYPGTQPMIPLRLTAVAAQNDMPVFTWIYADGPAAPVNYAHFEIPVEEITFFDFGGNDYQRQIGERADANDGQGFVTEFAGPSNTLEVTHPWLLAKTSEFSYVTRLTTTISPVEMTVDPVFEIDPSLEDVSNIKDASEMTGLYECERLEGVAIGSVNDSGSAIGQTGGDGDGAGSDTNMGLLLGLLALAGIGGIAFFAGKRQSASKAN